MMCIWLMPVVMNRIGDTDTTVKDIHSASVNPSAVWISGFAIGCLKICCKWAPLFLFVYVWYECVACRCLRSVALHSKLQQPPPIRLSQGPIITSLITGLALSHSLWCSLSLSLFLGTNVLLHIQRHAISVAEWGYANHLQLATFGCMPYKKPKIGMTKLFT